MNNGVIRLSRKGLKKFAFGDDGPPFEVDVVTTFQQWSELDEGYRDENRGVKDMMSYHTAAVEYVKHISKYNELTVAEAFDFIARLREAYDDVAVFFRPKSLEERGSPGTSAEGSENTLVKTEMRFSTEPA
jgi:hypothetical protein